MSNAKTRSLFLPFLSCRKAFFSFNGNAVKEKKILIKQTLIYQRGLKELLLEHSGILILRQEKIKQVNIIVVGVLLEVI